MGRLVERSDIVDFATYDDTRGTTRPLALAAKRPRRIDLHDNLTVLFENRDTLRYQIQEIMRVERIVRETDIQHEIETYNALLGEPGDLGCVLMIEIPNAQERAHQLVALHGLQARLYVDLDDGARVFASYDPTQVGDERISAVHYLRFQVAGRTPVAIGTDFHGLESHQALTPEQIAALTEDLAQQ